MFPSKLFDLSNPNIPINKDEGIQKCQQQTKIALDDHNLVRKLVPEV